jgi:hypothetical protein
MCLHPKMALKKTGKVITGRFEKRDIDSDKTGVPYYCDGDEALCACGAVFIIPFGPGLQTVEIEKEPAKIKN